MTFQVDCRLGQSMSAMRPGCVALLLLASGWGLADEPVFSGPQPGEKMTPFKVVGAYGPMAGKEFTVLENASDSPVLLVFVHEMTRPLLQLLRPVDAFADKWSQAGLKAHIVMLTADRTETDRFLARAKRSLNLKTPTSISLDGLEGPGNYGLNRKVTVTILVGKGDKVVANFAIVQPNETDAPKVLAALAKVVGKPTPSPQEIAAFTPRRQPAQRDPMLTSLMRQLIQKDNSPEKVQEIADKLVEWAGNHPRRKSQLRQLCQQVLKAGYGNDFAKKALQRLIDAK
ncbi:MAG: hypothetical protein KatS3mg105_3469 [Gemmatales bacterium]|nr:MAG: hypothetical protein KatS3mg105_3469 [Gemmatales bacterium]